MDASVISALAALTGAALGGFTSIVASLLAQRTQARVQWLAQEKTHRQQLYSEFIEAASKCHVDALQHDKADMPALVSLYVRIGRMRVVSSPPVVAAAEAIGRKIIDTYLEPDRNFLELREMVNSGAIDLLREFSDACRAEFATMRAQQF